MNLNDLLNGIYSGYTGADKHHTVSIAGLGLVYRAKTEYDCHMFIAELKCRLMLAESQQTEINNLKARLARVTDE